MTDADLANKRRFSRIEFDTEVRLVSDRGIWKCKLIDISLRGLLLTVPRIWQAEIGDNYLIELFAENEEAVIRMEVSVAHIGEMQVGFQCEHIDLDSIAHLRRLIELNIGNSEVLYRELSELGNPDSIT